MQVAPNLHGKNEIDQRRFDSCELALNWLRESVAIHALKEQASSAKDFTPFDTVQYELLNKGLISSNVFPTMRLV